MKYRLLLWCNRSDVPGFTVYLIRITPDGSRQGDRLASFSRFPDAIAYVDKLRRRWAHLAEVDR